MLLGQMAAAMFFSVSNDAATFDEVGQVASGVAGFEYHNLNFDPDQPPFSREWQTLPLRVVHMTIPPNEPANAIDETGFGRELLYTMNSDGRHILWLARVQAILLSLLFALAVFGFTRDLFGNGAALIALALVSLCPNIIAHGRLATTDVAVSGWLLVTSWMLWRAWRKHHLWYFAAAGAFGLALSSKYTALFFAPPYALLILMAEWSRKERQWLKRVKWSAVWCATVFGIGLGIIWLVYLSVDPHLRWTHPNFAAQPSLLKTISENFPVPAPYQQGLVLRIAVNQHRLPAFLFGSHYLGGRTLFYPALLAMKTPLGSLGLWALGLVALGTRRRWSLMGFVLFPPLFFLFVAIVEQIDIGVRHILMIYFFMPVVAGAVVLIRRRWVPIITILLILFTGVSTWSDYPSYLAYVNESFGGPNNGYTLVSDSNLDWGQDLYRAEDYLSRQFPHHQAAVIYFGTALVDPSVDYFNSANASWSQFGTSTPHIIAISASWQVYDPALWQRVLTWAGPRPIAQIGHSILIFRKSP